MGENVGESPTLGKFWEILEGRGKEEKGNREEEEEEKDKRGKEKKGK